MAPIVPLLAVGATLAGTAMSSIASQNAQDKQIGLQEARDKRREEALAGYNERMGQNPLETASVSPFAQQAGDQGVQGLQGLQDKITQMRQRAATRAGAQNPFV